MVRLPSTLLHQQRFVLFTLSILLFIYINNFTICLHKQTYCLFTTTSFLVVYSTTLFPFCLHFTQQRFNSFFKAIPFSFMFIPTSCTIHSISIFNRYLEHKTNFIYCSTTQRYLHLPKEFNTTVVPHCLHYGRICLRFLRICSHDRYEAPVCHQQNGKSGENAEKLPLIYALNLDPLTVKGNQPVKKKSHFG